MQYIVRRHAVRPTAYANQLRLFDRDAVARIRYELNAMEARRRAREVAHG